VNFFRRHGTQHTDTRYYDTQHNGLNLDSQQNKLYCRLSDVMPERQCINVVMQSVIMLSVVAPIFIDELDACTTFKSCQNVEVEPE